MKTLLVALILALGSSSSFAQSVSFDGNPSTPTPVGNESIALLGKGYADRKDPTHSMAFACVDFRADGQCRVGRFVEWKGHEATYIGYGILLPYKKDASGQDVLDTQTLKGNFQVVFSRTRRANEDARTARVLTIVVASAATVMGLVVGIPAFGLVYTVLFVLPNQGFAQFNPGKSGLSSENMAKVTRDQNGWNWSSKPKKLHHKVFESLLRDLKAM